MSNRPDPKPVEHSPLPWSTNEDAIIRDRAGNGRVLIDCDATGLSPSEAIYIAKMIVRAVNHHAELVAALEKAAAALERSYDASDWPADGTSVQELTAKDAEALLARIKEDQK